MPTSKSAINRAINLAARLEDIEVRLRALERAERVYFAGGGTAGAHNILSVTHTDSAADTIQRGDLIAGRGVGPSWKRLAHPGVADYALVSNGSSIEWTADPPWSGTASAHSILSATHTDSTAAVVQRGDMVIGRGASATWKRLAHPGVADYALVSNGSSIEWTADPPWSSGTAGAHSILSATHTDSTAAAVQQGDLMVGRGASATWKRLAHPSAANYALISNGSSIEWTADPPWSTGTGSVGRYSGSMSLVPTDAEFDSVTGTTAGSQNGGWHAMIHDLTYDREIVLFSNGTDWYYWKLDLAL